MELVGLGGAEAVRAAARNTGRWPSIDPVFLAQPLNRPVERLLRWR